MVGDRRGDPAASDAAFAGASEVGAANGATVDTSVDTGGSWVDEWLSDWTDFGTSDHGQPTAVLVSCDTLAALLVRERRAALGSKQRFLSRMSPVF